MSNRAAILMNDWMESNLIVMAARRAGFETTLCASPTELRDTIAQQPPRVLLMDVHLPGENGLHLLETLRSTGQLETTAVLLLSALRFPEVVQRAAAAGVKEFISKPVHCDRLVERLQKFL